MARPRKNNADYFSHDVGMRKDGRVLVLRSKYGHEGYAAYCMTLELLTGSDNFQLDTDEVEIEIISADFGFSPIKLQEIWCEAQKLRLLVFSEGTLSCPKLTERMEPLLEERKRQRGKAQRRWRESGETVAGDSFTEVLPRENHGETMQSKVNKSNSKKKTFVPPTLNEFQRYWIDNGYCRNKAENAFSGYDVAEWYDSKGNKIKNWKQKCQHVWFKPENKILSGKKNTSQMNSMSNYE